VAASGSLASPNAGEKPPFFLVAIENSAELEPYIPAWDDLAASAIEPNSFYESWTLLPALRAYGTDQSLTVVLVFANNVPQSRGQPLLCGLFPLERRRRLAGLVRVVSFWHYRHCYLGVPLVRAGFGRECLRVFFDWLATDRRGGTLLECWQITAEGAFYPLLVEHLREHDRSAFVAACHTRALLRNKGDDRYLETVLSGEKRKKLRRAEERLAQTGPITYVALDPDGDIETWLADFLRLEASGWKGRQGTALSCNEVDRTFFLDVARAAFQRRQLMMLALQVAGRPVAQLCNFLAGEGSFAFKVAFDEEYARFSPGVLLELENIRRTQAAPLLRWMDSCTEADNTLLQLLWVDRRVIQTVLVATGPAPGPLFLALLPCLRWLRRRASACVRWFLRRRDTRPKDLQD
jgi:CelD/BcsL family acetyltransferase involved in cellulose biosynthesis